MKLGLRLGLYLLFISPQWIPLLLCDQFITQGVEKIVRGVVGPHTRITKPVQVLKSIVTLSIE